MDLLSDYASLRNLLLGPSSPDAAAITRDPPLADNRMPLYRRPDSTAEQIVSPQIDEFESFVSSTSHVLTRDPAQTVALAYNLGGNGIVAQSAEAVLSTSGPLVIRLNRPKEQQWITGLRQIQIEGHITQSAFDMTPDGQTAVVVGSTGITVVDLSRSGSSMKFIPATGLGHSVSVSADASRAICGGDLSVWDLRSGVALFASDENAIHVALSSDGRIAVTSSTNVGDACFKVWNVAEMRVTFSCPRVGGARALALSPDGCFVIIAVNHGIELWDLNQFSLIGSLEKDGLGHAMSVSWSHDGQTIASGHEDGTVVIWDAIRGVARSELNVGDGWIKCVAVSMDGRTVLTGTNHISIWDVVSRSCTQRLYTGHVVSARLSLNQARACWISGTYYYARVVAFSIWDIRRDMHVDQDHRAFADLIDQIAILPRHRGWLTAHRNGDIRLWDNNGRRRVGPAPAYIPNICDLAVLGESDALVARYDGPLLLWNYELRASRQVFAEIPASSVRPLENTAMVLVSTKSGFGLFDVSSEEVNPIFQGCEVNGLQISIDNTLAVVQKTVPVDEHSFENRQSIWDLRTRREMKTIDHGSWAAAFSPDGQHILSIRNEGTVELTALHLVQSSNLPVHNVGRVAIAPGGRAVLLALHDNSIQCWDLATQTCNWAVRSPGALSISELAVRGDGRVAIISNDKALTIYDMETGKRLASYDSGEDRIEVVQPALRPVCCRVAGELHVLDFLNVPPPDAAIVTACRLWLGPRKWMKIGFRDRWAKHLSAKCGWCSTRFKAPSSCLEAISYYGQAIGAHGAPCLALPVSAWEDQRLRTTCPNCKGPVRFNPFVVDRRN